MKSKMKKILAVLLMVCLVVPSAPSRVAEATDKFINEFASVTDSTTAVNVGNYAYNDSQVNTTMVNGALFVFHTKVKLPLEDTSDKTDITLTGWGETNYEKMFLEFRHDLEGWFFQVESQKASGAAQWGAFKTYLSEKQCNKIKNEGLDLYLVKNGTYKYDVYMENSELSDVEFLYQWTSADKCPQIYEVNNKKADVITTG